MPINHILLAVLVAIVWGVNFIFVKFSLNEVSPLLLCALRFILASIPAIFFIKPPKIPFITITVYAFIMFALQFFLLFFGMHVGMTPGLASIIMQTQIFFSLIFAALFLDEWPSTLQVSAACFSFSGIALIAMHFDSTVSLLGFICIIGGAASWGVGNLIIKKNKNCNMIALVVWSSFIAAFPMSLLSLFIEGPSNIIASFHQLTLTGIISLLYIAYISTLVGYGVWNWLLSRNPVSVVVPFTLLIPVVGMISSMLMLNEPMQTWKLMAALLMISGLCINIISVRFSATNRIPVSENLITPDLNQQT